jgi:hypothetical protein
MGAGKYLGTIILSDRDNPSFTLSKELDTDDKQTVFNALMTEAKASMDNIDTILLYESTIYPDEDGLAGLGYPRVHKFWRAENGDFDDIETEEWEPIFIGPD